MLDSRASSQTDLNPFDAPWPKDLTPRRKLGQALQDISEEVVGEKCEIHLSSKQNAFEGWVELSVRRPSNWKLASCTLTKPERLLTGNSHDLLCAELMERDLRAVCEELK